MRKLITKHVRKHKELAHKHKKKIVAVHAIALIGIFSASTVTTGQVVAFFMPHGEEVLVVGETSSIDININAKIPINAVGMTVQYSPDILEIVGFSRKDSFLTLWTEDTIIREEVGELHFSGGTTQENGFTGVGTTLTLTVRGKQAGEAQLSFKDTAILAHDGFGTVVQGEERTFTYTISEPEPETTPEITGGGAASPPESISESSTPKPPDPDLNGDGEITIADVSVLLVQMFSSYDPRYDLNMNGRVGIEDLSILLSRMN